MEPLSRIVLSCVILFALLTTALFVSKTRPAHADTATSKQTLIQLEAEFMQAAAEKGSAGYMSYYADDAVELPNGAAAIHGKVNIAKDMGFLDQKDNRLIWTPVGADVSSSGDLGYTYGTFEFDSKGKDGKPVVERGKYTSIWKRQSDGSWKVVLDMGNAG